MTGIDLQPTWMGDGEYLRVMRGVPSPSFLRLFNREAETTWFTDRHAAVEDASWVTDDDELALVEVGVVHRHDAHDVRNGFVTIQDPALVDTWALETVDRLTREEMDAQGRAMLQIIADDPTLEEYVKEQTTRIEELQREREDDE
jgi:hypothetical protein